MTGTCAVVEDVTPPDALPAVAGRVVVAMSGGVDSSVVAAWLADSGHDVVGISMRLYAEAKAAGKSCCSPDDLFDARNVASRMGFPFYVANYQQEFQQRVIDTFLAEYARGRTPSPCVMCNNHLKFDILLQRMLALGGEVLATGHYARIERRDDRWALLRGVDGNKDQSYFLFGLNRQDLARIRFPLGGLTKPDVRRMAAKWELDVAEKPESQDICFVGGGNYAAFVEERLGSARLIPGQIVLEATGQVLGQHTGIHRFTIGQRRGLSIGWPEPLFVVGLDAASGTVLVAPRSGAARSRFVMTDCNWLRWESPPVSWTCSVQVRNRQRSMPCDVQRDLTDPRIAHVVLHTADMGISPGQAAVLYDGDEVLGGGWVDRVEAE